jgi:hypothetical protein
MQRDGRRCRFSIPKGMTRKGGTPGVGREISFPMPAEKTTIDAKNTVEAQRAS